MCLKYRFRFIYLYLFPYAANVLTATEDSEVAMIQGKEECKDQESIKFSTTTNPGHHN